MKTHCTRGLRYLVNDDEASALISDYREAFGQAFAVVSKHVFDNYSHLTSFHNLSKPKGFKKDIRTVILAETSDLIGECGITTYKRNVVMCVLSNYKSFYKRNKKKFPTKPIMLKNNKGVRFDDCCVTDKNGTLVFPGLNGSKITASYYHPGTVGKNRQFMQTKTNKGKLRPFGGTLSHVHGTWKFIAQYNRPITYQYEPQDWIGTDFNLTDSEWIVMSRQDVDKFNINKSDDIRTMEDEIQDVCDILRDKTTTGGKRRYFNNRRIELHKRHRKLIEPIVDSVIGMCQDWKCGIAIDNVQTGQQKGTWGQDKLISLLLTKCEEQGIPHHLSSAYYTSQKCSACGYTAKENRLFTSCFKCVKCGYESCAHENAAKNTRQIAIQEYNVSGDNVE